MNPSDISPLSHLPEEALRRLEQRPSGIGKAAFTSDLSVNEFLLVKETGFSPVGMVLGTSVYHVGLQLRTGLTCRELTGLSQAMYHARDLAMTRMEAEADKLGADGIVGVRLEIEHQEWGRDIAEFLAIGTAVKADANNSIGTQWRNNKGMPFTSDLSGQDFATLIRTGYAPLGLTMGTCVYQIPRASVGTLKASFGRNYELPIFTQALYDARELAMARMQAEAAALEADGIVGAQLHQRNHSWGAHTTEFMAFGTAVRAFREDHVIERPQLVLGLDS